MSCCDLPAEVAQEQHDKVAAGLRSAIDGHSATIVPTFSAFCHDEAGSMTDESGRLLYSDWNHLKDFGSRVAAQAIAMPVGDPGGPGRQCRAAARRSRWAT